MVDEEGRGEASLRREASKVKDLEMRSFEALTRNFYLMRSALRYFSHKKGLSFTASDVSDEFPLTIPVAGSCLRALEMLDIVEGRGSSRKRYMPEGTDLSRMEDLGEVLRENQELEDFRPGD